MYYIVKFYLQGVWKMIEKAFPIWNMVAILPLVRFIVVVIIIVFHIDCIADSFTNK